MKKAEVMDEILDIFIRKAMEETQLRTADKQNMRVVTCLNSSGGATRPMNLKKQKQKNNRSDRHELYTTPSIR